MLESFIIKVAFIYVVNEKAIYYKGLTYTPTIRVAAQVHPEIKMPYGSIAISNIDTYQHIKPIVILRSK